MDGRGGECSYFDNAKCPHCVSSTALFGSSNLGDRQKHREQSQCNIGCPLWSSLKIALYGVYKAKAVPPLSKATSSVHDALFGPSQEAEEATYPRVAPQTQVEAQLQAVGFHSKQPESLHAF